MSELSHIRADGSVTMVDVGAKEKTPRKAVVAGLVEINEHTLGLLESAALPKGDALTTAKIAGIMAAKETARLIPMCHPLNLTHIDIRFSVQKNPPAIRIEAEAQTMDRTGVEMEALIAAQTAAATIYDMCKAAQKDIVIRDMRLVHKSGGKSGTFTAERP